jgi:hypothetical protein
LLGWGGRCVRCATALRTERRWRQRDTGRRRGGENRHRRTVTLFCLAGLTLAAEKYWPEYDGSSNPGCGKYGDCDQAND